ncbi:MAG TPA: hypothetical protein VGV61_15845, partial [Thermoanaerobaculia bacterium]|nr:hypothetical protein [Thermoanaerobaculia bacterium]
MSRSAGESGAGPLSTRTRVAVATLALALAGAAGGGRALRAETSGPPVSSFELSRSVSQTLLHLQEIWLQWISAFNQEDRHTAATQVAELRTAVRRLGFSRLPELSLGATVRAISAARQGDLKRAEWALEDAEALDPGRPETAFGSALVAWEGKHYLRAASMQLVGYARLLTFAAVEGLVLEDLILAALAVALLAGGLFVVVQLATKGSRLYFAIGSHLSMLPTAACHALTIALLVWPLLLPTGLVWALLYWSVLLWGFGSISERLVTILLWVLLGAAPLAIAQQHQRIAEQLAPPARALEALSEGRLYGALFTDLGVLPAMLPNSITVRQMLGDLHRLLGQWDEARIYYGQVVEKEPNNVDALIDLGAYHFLR